MELLITSFIIIVCVTFCLKAGLNSTRAYRNCSWQEKKSARLKLADINGDAEIRFKIRRRIKASKALAQYNMFTNQIGISHYLLAKASDTELRYAIYHEYGHSVFRFRHMATKRNCDYERQAEQYGFHLSGITQEEWKLFIVRFRIRMTALEYSARKSAFSLPPTAPEH